MEGNSNPENFNHQSWFSPDGGDGPGTLVALELFAVAGFMTGGRQRVLRPRLRPWLGAGGRLRQRLSMGKKNSRMVRTTWGSKKVFSTISAVAGKKTSRADA